MPSNRISPVADFKSAADSDRQSLVKDSFLIKDVTADVVVERISKDNQSALADQGVAPSKILQFVISTGDVDRDGDTINPTGWDFTEFQKGGVVLWAHDSSKPPIAKPLGVWVEGGKVKSRADFSSAGLGDNEHAKFMDLIYNMYCQGLMRSVSVGFLPTSWKEASRGGFMPMDFQTQKLMEYSCVPVPSNPHALLDGKAKGLDLAPLLSWAERILDEGGSHVVIPLSKVELTRKLLNNSLSLSVPGLKDVGTLEIAPIEAIKETPMGDPPPTQEPVQMIAATEVVASASATLVPEQVATVAAEDLVETDPEIEIDSVTVAGASSDVITLSASDVVLENPWDTWVDGLVAQENQKNDVDTWIKSEAFLSLVRDETSAAIRRARGLID